MIADWRLVRVGTNNVQPEIQIFVLKIICDVGRENVPFVAESEAEQIKIIHHSVINYAFLGLIGFNHFKVFSNDCAKS